MILLEVVTGASPLRISSAPYAHPTAPGTYEERLLDTSWLERRLFAPARGTLGRMVLGNLDGRLDWLAWAELDRRMVRLLVGEADYGGFVPAFSGLVEQAVVGRDEVTLVLGERRQPFDGEPMRDRLAASGGAWTGCDASGPCRLRPLPPPDVVLEAVPEPVGGSPAIPPFGRRRWRASLELTRALAALDVGMVVAVGDARLLVTGLRLAPVHQRLAVALWG